MGWASRLQLVFFLIILWYDRTTKPIRNVKVISSEECVPKHKLLVMDMWFKAQKVGVRYDTRCYFNVLSKADISQLNLPHGTDN